MIRERAIKGTPRRLFCACIILVIAICCVLASTQNAHASTNKEDLITSLKNPSNGTLSFYVYAPAKTTAKYSITLTPNNKGTSIDTVTGSVKNTTNKGKKIKVSKSVHYYSSKYSYKVKGSYTYKRKNYTDTDSKKSLIPSTTFTSTKFVWDEKTIKDYKAGRTVGVVVLTGATVILDIAITKGVATTTLKNMGTSYTACKFVSDLVIANSSSDVRTSIQKGWGYRTKTVPNADCTGYTAYLIVYSPDGKIAENKNIGTFKMSPYCKVIK